MRAAVECNNRFPLMSKQRFLFVVAVLCLAQLGIIVSQQLQEKDSDLNTLRDGLQSASGVVSSLLAGDQSSTNDGLSLNKSQSSRASDKGAITSQPARATTGELAPTLLHNEDTNGRTAQQGAEHSQPQGVKASVRDPAKAESTARDPFVPFFSIRSNARGDNPYPLTEYDISELRVAAIVSDAAGNRSASVEALGEKSFIVKVGTKIGKNGGRVESISATTITISEPTTSTFNGQGLAIKELSLKTYPTPLSALAQ